MFFAVFLSPALSLDMQSPSTEGLLYYLCDLCASVYLCACVLTLVTSSVCAAASPEQRPVRRSSRRQSAQRRTETPGDASAPETGGKTRRSRRLQEKEEPTDDASMGLCGVFVFFHLNLAETVEKEVEDEEDDSSAFQTPSRSRRSSSASKLATAVTAVTTLSGMKLRSSSRRKKKPERFSPSQAEFEADAAHRYKGVRIDSMKVKELRQHLRAVHYPNIDSMGKQELEETLVDFIKTFPERFDFF